MSFWALLVEWQNVLAQRVVGAGAEVSLEFLAWPEPAAKRPASLLSWIHILLWQAWKLCLSAFLQKFHSRKYDSLALEALSLHI